ncbi:hypothetical protein BMJ29_04460 [Sinorhizobium medicae]|uniref:Uncharacterized protein n=1 Tax=Sinorhizobium medicae TaxID=110321 RepID=A0ABX4TFA2_9HYPH|nr:hypothetical protein BMJ33_26405 [Sinorhizobium medicae]PLU23628.1 hypothetical protein BMJ29_04460 [Sinorhizobium medicae]PLU79512.1 hypothetical protein BMJ19_12445 [Sinorhizobium medicae]
MLGPILGFAINWPLVEFAIAIIWFCSLGGAWKGQPKEGGAVSDPGERELGATVILSELNGILTGCSIIIAGIGAFVAIVQQPNCIDPITASHLGWAAIYAGLALVSSLYTMATLPTRVASRNVLHSKGVAFMCAAALLSALLAAGRFMVGTASLLW